MRAFLKWAGGKYTIREHILNALPSGNRLIEPFTGAGSIFLNSDYPAYLLAEKNIDLIHLYQYLQQEGEDFIADCRSYFQPKNNCAEQYAEFRIDFNNTLHQPKFQRKRALLFIYLNRHCFNGLCRYNRKGGFNVPFGQYTAPLLPEESLRYFHKKSQQAVFQYADFRETLNSAVPGDVIYCDPPYVPLSKTALFSSYNNTFTAQDHQDLSQLAEKTRAKGIPVIISNHDTPETRAYYKNAQITSLNVSRVISCNAQGRNKVAELIAVY